MLIEQEGLRRALQRAEAAEIRLFVFDAAHPAGRRRRRAGRDPTRSLSRNKIDLMPPLRDRFPILGAFPISALTGEGVDSIGALGERVAQNYRIEAPVLTRARHRQALEETVGIAAALALRHIPELRAEDLRLALRSLGRITGAVDVEDLLDVIFRDFCIGK